MTEHKCFHLQAADPADVESRFLSLWRHWHSPNPAQVTWVVIPQFSHAASWKRVLLKKNEPIFAVEFLTPSQLRTRLGEAWGLATSPLRGREESLFLLQELARADAATSPMLRSLSRDARPLLHAIDQLSATGHDLGILDPILGSPRIRRAWESLAAQDAARDRSQRDSALRARSLASPASLAPQVIVLGFDLQHIGSALLLEAALRGGRRSAVLSLNPHIKDETSQLVWLSLVESWLPQAENRIPGESNSTAEPCRATESFYLAPDQSGQIELTVRLAQRALRNATVETRVALVVPGDGAFASALAQALRAAQLPFHTEFRTPLPLRYEQAILKQWLELQQHGLRAADVITFWKIMTGVPEFAVALQVESIFPAKLEKFLLRAFQAGLEDQVEVASVLSFPGASCPPELTRFLNRWQTEWLWPENAPLADYLTLLETQLPGLLGPHIGRQIREFLRAQVRSIAELWPQAVTRDSACRLFLPFVERPEVVTSESPWIGLHLVSASTARGQRWEEIILTCLNEGQWPQLPREIPLLPDSLRQQLNHAAQTASPDTLDATTYLPGKYPLLTDALAYHLARSGFYYLRETAPKISYLAAAWDELERHTGLHPSELYRAAWTECHDHPWSDTLLPELLAQARSTELLPAPEGTLDAMLRAQHERRDPTTPFGPFQFRLTSRPHPAMLAVSGAEKILKDPATQWFERLLRVETERPTWIPDNVFSLFQGNLLHHAISSALPGPTDTFQPWPTLERLQERACQHVHHQEQALRRAHESALQPLPVWWSSEWARLQYLVRTLIFGVEAIRVELSCGFVASEMDLSRAAQNPASLPESISWRGQADLILSDAPEWKAATRLVIVDFKTGQNADTFKPCDLRKSGTYFQLLAYATLAAARTERPVAVSVAVINRHAHLPSSVAEMDPADSNYEPLWQVVHAAWVEGCFGQALPVRDRFGINSTLPLATLPVPRNLLAAKWTLTPELADWERF